MILVTDPKYGILLTLRIYKCKNGITTELFWDELAVTTDYIYIYMTYIFMSIFIHNRQSVDVKQKN